MGTLVVVGVWVGELPVVLCQCRAQRLRSDSGYSPPMLTLPVVTDDLVYLQEHFLPRNGQLLNSTDEVSTVQRPFSLVTFT